MALTVLQIDNLKPRERSFRISDGQGLALEVSPKGSKLWRFRFQYDGKEQTISLGKYPSISLADARRKRDDMRQMVANGIHPTKARQADCKASCCGLACHAKAKVMKP